MKKLLFVVNVDWFFISHRLPIALAAKKLGYEVHIATTITDKIEVLQQHEFIIHPIKIDRGSSNLIGSLNILFHFFKIFKSVKPDIIHLVTIKPVLIGGIAARLVGAPSVVSAVSGLGFVFVAKGTMAEIRRLTVGLLYRIALGHKNNKVIFQNTDDRKSLVNLTKLPIEKTTLIHGSGVDLRQYRVTPQKNNSPIIIMAARLLIEKGVREFVQAANSLRNEYKKKARFILVGEPDPENPNSLSAQELQQWKQEGIIEYFGHRSDMPEVLSMANIVVLPSYYGEGLPKVLIEAAACGRAVITTDHPGCRDAIEPRKSGILVPIRDSKALANAINYLLDNPELCEAMGRAGRDFAERTFDVKQVVAEHLNIYNELLAKVKK